MAQMNFLIGRGELLAQDIVIKKGGATKKDSYTLLEARQALAPQITATSESLSQLPDEACGLPQPLAH